MQPGHKSSRRPQHRISYTQVLGPEKSLRRKMGGGGRRSNGLSSSSSSGEEDGDADWKAAIDSVAVTTIINGRTSTDRIASTSIGSSTKSLGRATQQDEDGEVDNRNPQNLKHYQIKAQKLLDGIFEKTIEIVGEDPIHILDDDSMISGGGVRLFKHAPPGIVFDHTDELQRPTKKPRILPGKEIDEKSKKFRWQLQSIAVDGMDIVAAAKHSHQKTLSKREAKDAAAKAAANREEERVAELRKIRGRDGYLLLQEICGQILEVANLYSAGTMPLVVFHRVMLYGLSFSVPLL